MRTVHQLDPTLEVVVAHDAEMGWSIEVNAKAYLRCVFGEEHPIEVHALRMVGRHTDPVLLNAFEWAIRGRRHAVMQVASAIIDDEISEHFVDPCLKE